MPLPCALNTSLRCMEAWQTQFLVLETVINFSVNEEEHGPIAQMCNPTFRASLPAEQLFCILGHLNLPSAFDIFQKVVCMLGALHRRSKFTNFCHDLKQNHLS